MARRAVATPIRPRPITPKTRPRKPPDQRGARVVEAAQRIGDQILMIADNAAAERQHQTDSVVGDLAGAVVGRVTNRDADGGRRREIDMVEADSGPDDDAAAPQSGNKGGVDFHLVPRDQRVAGAKGFVGQLAERVRAADIPVDVAAGCLAFNDAIVRILRVRREQAKPGHGYASARSR